MNFIKELNKDPGKPMQVTYAVTLLVAYLGVSLLINLLNLLIILFAMPAGVSPGYLLSYFLFNVLAYLVMFLVAKKIADRRNWARWVLGVGFVFILISSICSVGQIMSGDAITGILTLSQVVVTAMAVALLFQRPSSQWFTGAEED